MVAVIEVGAVVVGSGNLEMRKSNSEYPHTTTPLSCHPLSLCLFVQDDDDAMAKVKECELGHMPTQVVQNRSCCCFHSITLFLNTFLSSWGVDPLVI